MRHFILFIFFITLSKFLDGQKLTAYGEKVYVETNILTEKDSIVADITITNFREDTIFIPVNSSNNIKSEYCILSGELSLRVGATTCYSGLPLEFSYQLGMIPPKGKMGLKIQFLLKDEINAVLLSVDFISSKDYPVGVKRENAEYTIMADYYASVIHVFRSTFKYFNKGKSIFHINPVIGSVQKRY